MKHFLLLIVLLMCSTSLFAQHTKRYLELTKNLKPVDSVKATFKYKDRKQIMYIVEK